MFNAVLKSSKLKRTVFFLSGDAILLSFSLYLSFYLRFDGNIASQYMDKFPAYLLIFLAVKFIVFATFCLYKMSWAYVGFYEILGILKANTVSLFLLLGIIFIFWAHSLFKEFPRSIPFIDYLASLMFIVIFRTSKRFYIQAIRNGRDHKGSKKRTLIIGAGNAGEQIVRDMRRQQNCPYLPVGFIDDDIMKQRIYIQGVKVLGNRMDISSLVERLKIDIILLAIPAAASRDIRDILSYVRQSSVKDIKIIPGLNALVNRNISLSDIKEVQIEDIIGREQAPIDKKVVGSFVHGKKVLITGAGGSIGSELVRQVAAFNPAKIIALDIDESELHQVELEFKDYYAGNCKLEPVVADVRDQYKIELIFNDYLPHMVFHAAAYKHVPIMEKYPEEAVKVNIFGTKIVAEAALASGVEKFVFVSTDKAVKPVSVMGATKQAAEKILKELNSLEKTRFISVRFGNVVRSRGSVIPLFEKQIRKGGPVTITHEEMKRYFMSIPEACVLILQAGAMGKGGEVFRLDMGEQVKIVDIARELIRMNGLEPDVDIPIVFTGTRPGERLGEELLTDSEHVISTGHPKIFMVKDTNNKHEYIIPKVLLFEEIIERKQWAWIRNLLKDIVPSYNPAYNEGVALNICRHDVKVMQENFNLNSARICHSRAGGSPQATCSPQQIRLCADHGENPEHRQNTGFLFSQESTRARGSQKSMKIPFIPPLEKGDVGGF